MMATALTLSFESQLAKARQDFDKFMAENPDAVFIPQFSMTLEEIQKQRCTVTDAEIEAFCDDGT